MQLKNILPEKTLTHRSLMSTKTEKKKQDQIIAQYIYMKFSKMKLFVYVIHQHRQNNYFSIPHG